MALTHHVSPVVSVSVLCLCSQRVYRLPQPTLTTHFNPECRGQNVSKPPVLEIVTSSACSFISQPTLPFFPHFNQEPLSVDECLWFCLAKLINAPSVELTRADFFFSLSLSLTFWMVGRLSSVFSKSLSGGDDRAP